MVYIYALDIVYCMINIYYLYDSKLFKCLSTFGCIAITSHYVTFLTPTIPLVLLISRFIQLVFWFPQGRIHTELFMSILRSFHTYCRYIRSLQMRVLTQQREQYH